MLWVLTILDKTAYPGARLYHGPRCNGGTGKLVKFAAVFLPPNFFQMY